MLLSVLLLALLVGIAIRQSTQGLFGAMLMTALTVCCASASLGLYEWVGARWTHPLISGWNADYTLPVTLALLFAVPLALLRLVFDQLIRRRCLLPALVDRIGGGVCGLITAIIFVGITAICLQMVPFQNGVILGFSRVTAVDPKDHQMSTPPPEDEKERNLWFHPDRFAVGLGRMVSDGLFSGPYSFGEDHPALVQTLGWVNAAHSEVSRYAPPNSIKVVGNAPVDLVYLETREGPRNDPDSITYEPRQPKSGRTFRMIRVRLGQKAKDKRKSHVFTLRQFRLVGRTEGGRRLAQYHPMAIQQEDASQPINRHVYAKREGRKIWPATQDRFSPRVDNNGEVELVFELPEDFAPRFIEYKHGARATVKFEEDETTAARSVRQRPSAASKNATPTSASTRNSRNGTTSSRRNRPTRRRRHRNEEPAKGSKARVRTVGTATNKASAFSDALPMTLTSYRRLKNAELQGRRLLSGHLVGFVDEQGNGTNPPLEQFDVPSDQRLLQLSTLRLKARSTLGRALSRAVEVAQNYYVEDEGGKRYKVIGKYAISTVNGRKVVEVQYFPNPGGAIGGLGTFDKINERNLSKSDTYALLFLVDPGARIVRFSTGGAATRSDDLTLERLVAPP